MITTMSTNSYSQRLIVTTKGLKRLLILIDPAMNSRDTSSSTWGLNCCIASALPTGVSPLMMDPVPWLKVRTMANTTWDLTLIFADLFSG